MLISDTGGLNKLWKLFEHLRKQAAQRLNNLTYPRAFRAILDAAVPKTP